VLQALGISQLEEIYAARGEGTNSPRLFTPGEREALAKSKVHQFRGRRSPTVGGNPH
jgi:hypothetical protein